MIFQVSTKAQVENSQASEKSNFDYIEEIVDQVFTSDKYKVFLFDGVDVSEEFKSMFQQEFASRDFSNILDYVVSEDLFFVDPSSRYRYDDKIMDTTYDERYNNDVL